MNGRMRSLEFSCNWIDKNNKLIERESVSRVMDCFGDLFEELSSLVVGRSFHEGGSLFFFIQCICSVSVYGLNIHPGTGAIKKFVCGILSYVEVTFEIIL